MPVSFATTTARPYDKVTVNVTGLTASTVYVANFAGTSTGANRGHAMDFTTDASGNATLEYVASNRALNGITCTVTPKVAAAAATSSNTLTVV